MSNIYYNLKELNYYQNLWRAVVLRLVLDLNKHYTFKGKSQLKKNYYFNLNMKAKQYLKNNLDDLKIICDFADIDFNYFLQNIKKLNDEIKK